MSYYPSDEALEMAAVSAEEWDADFASCASNWFASGEKPDFLACELMPPEADVEDG